MRVPLAHGARSLVELPPDYRRAAIFCLLAAMRLVTGIENAEGDLLASPPQIGLLARLGMLARARWFRVP